VVSGSPKSYDKQLRIPPCLVSARNDSPMSLSSLPLSYCTNVHPGLTAEEVVHGLTNYAAPIAASFAQPLAAGLWLAKPVIDELLTSETARSNLCDALKQQGLSCYTLNAFPYGNFHSDRVKEQVYLPDWTTDDRRNYTLACVTLLSRLMPEDVEGSVSTVPLGFKSLATDPEFRQHCGGQLIRTAIGLAELKRKSRRTVRLAIEPEPCCVLETTAETLEFFEQLLLQCRSEVERQAVQEHLGVCYDICHQSVEFEDVAESIQSLVTAGIRINKVHITNAIEVQNPGDNPAALAALAQYVEPRYLHQTFAKSATGTTCQIDLDQTLCESPSDEFRTADCWRVHFHVPVDRESLGPLGTTRADLVRALAAVATLDYAPHLEVETYTWEVLPSGEKPDLVTGFSRELIATHELLNGLN